MVHIYSILDTKCVDYLRNFDFYQYFCGYLNMTFLFFSALLNMNDILTSEQINAVFAGDKPVGGMSSKFLLLQKYIISLLLLLSDYFGIW